MKEYIAFTGGGTGGHLFPGMAVAEELQQVWGGSLYWIGSGSGMERSLVEKWGILYYGIPAGKLRRYLSLRNIIDVFKIGAGCIAAFHIMRKKRPKVLFSKGGFVSVPPVFAARLLKVPVVTHESDSDPGLATKIISRYSDTICLSWEQSAAYFPSRLRPRLRITGNPVRKEIFRGDRREGRALLGIGEQSAVLLVLGGSQGARQINRLINENLIELLSVCSIIHQTGDSDPVPPARAGYHPFGFIGEELPHFIAAADLVVSRAGANTLCELGGMGKAIILIPLEGAASRGDQERNARMFSEAGAGVLYKGSFVEPIKKLLADKEKRAVMGKAAESLVKKDAASIIKDIILEYSGG